MSAGSQETDDSTMSASEKLAYVMEVRDIFGDDAAESVADQLGIYLPGLTGEADPERLVNAAQQG